nr:iron-sulfur cluster assembly accessory protein [Thermodesulfitimonas autotrophica]
MKADDTVFTAGEIKFAVDKATEPYLEGAVLDYANTWLGGGFTISRPGASSCGGSCSSC